MNKIIFNENSKRLSACGKPFLLPIGLVEPYVRSNVSYVPDVVGRGCNNFSQRRKGAIENETVICTKKIYLYH